MFGKTPRQVLGNNGEDLAASYLTKNGYRILTRNFRTRFGELDIVCLKAGTVVYVEVKTRIGRLFGTPEEAITTRKIRRILTAANIFQSAHPELPESIRLDCVSVEFDPSSGKLARLEHIENITQ
ncbi:hypothetical protein A2Z33_05040 [Candidatus Gottesmanbacteria bacterium RBG_16_52_11]|uniref:UPF0102 protein A2Z33_05040 n=1 Tax=Candidatus Gottesmanbacteria bacterium RBG_16_52_11 TaxID=1798374 RepID=A0A1F5YQD9_9BACT|nr:MAG: hypothetical protein A2Z33_05040 [Candidatus Gottesmanbacteria bacterium RBG_16_52_11]